ncbi:hypothetical protein A3K63_04350 [Candidatus Micrarchaeota archaeon RBG_16_49_10]|nr:MAG: hypothetical protein A3K63_04350 [Candidatus Micrarchaeota archaeon RBG_16_49_10]
MFLGRKKKVRKMISEKTGKTLLLAFDHAFEHGPAKYEKVDLDPVRIAKIALEGFADGVIVHAGAAKMIRKLIPKEMALIVKVTGKTSLSEEEIQSIVTTVKEAKKIGADGVAATLYVGSPYEHIMLEHFAKIKQDCLKYKMPLVGFAYPRVKGKKKNDTDAVMYAARVCAELGCDLVKTYYTGSKESFKKVVDSCFAPLACSGGEAISEAEFLKKAQDIMDAGANGMVVGRNVWMSEQPGLMLAKLHDIVYRRGAYEANHRNKL